ncbi:hypothetical protein BDR07DRAFT_1409266 [Suillus spraguei]|nr:hypothetical protein BDR07DRAFT_1409266 [Suillus spraguei]
MLRFHREQRNRRVHAEKTCSHDDLECRNQAHGPRVKNSSSKLSVHRIAAWPMRNVPKYLRFSNEFSEVIATKPASENLETWITARVAMVVVGK